MILGLVFLFGLTFGLFLIMYEDGKSFALAKKMRCKLGYHDRMHGFGRTKTAKYYCKQCRKPRKHPKLTMIEGGNKMGNSDFNF